MAESPEIVVKDLDIGYGDFVVLHNLHFTVNRGDIFAIMGEVAAAKAPCSRY